MAKAVGEWDRRIKNRKEETQSFWDVGVRKKDGDWLREIVGGTRRFDDGDWAGQQIYDLKQTQVEEEAKKQEGEERTLRIQRRLGTVDADCDEEDSVLGDEEDQEKQGEG
jgi:hypothetical protein